jgi:hypothetical protein
MQDTLSNNIDGGIPSNAIIQLGADTFGRQRRDKSATGVRLCRPERTYVHDHGAPVLENASVGTWQQQKLAWAALEAFVEDCVAPVLELELVIIIVRMFGMESDHGFWKETRYPGVAD